MGFIDTSTDETLPFFYNLVHAVGRSCPNFRDDVKLIQYLLIAFYAKSDVELGWKKPPGDLKVSGACDQTTLNWILDFQMNLQKSYGNATLDGRIDRIRNKNLIGSISRTQYTLAYLNRGVMNFNPDAFVATPSLIPLENPLNVPPPSNDVVREIPKGAPASRGGVPASKVGGA